MKGHCTCQATGLSSHAIARRVERCLSGGNDYPRDPADLLRCVNYCAEMGVTTARLAEVMVDVSPQWAALVAEWDSLVAEMWDEYPSGMAPRTFRRMKELTAGARA